MVIVSENWRRRKTSTLLMMITQLVNKAAQGGHRAAELLSRIPWNPKDLDEVREPRGLSVAATRKNPLQGNDGRYRSVRDLELPAPAPPCPFDLIDRQGFGLFSGLA